MTTIALLAALTSALANAAEVTLELPPPEMVVIAPSAVGQMVVLELVAEGKTRHLIPDADTYVWKGADDPKGHKRSLILRDNGWSVVFLRFPAKDLLEAEAVRLKVPMGGVERAGAGRFSVHRMLVPWDETATWFSSGRLPWEGPIRGEHYAAEPAASLNLPDPSGGRRLVTIEGLASLVAGWRDGTYPNHGILLRFDGRAVQTSVRSRENLGMSDYAVLGDGSQLAFRWEEALFARLLQAPEDLRDVALSISVVATDEAVGGVLEFRADDGGALVGRLNIARAGKNRYEINDLGAGVLSGGLLASWRGEETVSVLLKGDAAERPLATVTIVDRPAVALFPDSNPIKEGVYCEVIDGHLTYGGERLRLWGTIGFGSKPRMRALGFNAFRLHGPRLGQGVPSEVLSEHGMRGELPPVREGDGSGIDGFDREMAEARALGLFVMANYRHRNWIPGAERRGSFVDDGGDFEAWRQALSENDWEPGKLAKYVNLVDPRFERIHKRWLSLMLDRVNPYTGTRYAEEEAIVIQELGNEQRVVKDLLEGTLRKLPDYFQRRYDGAWNDYLRQRYANDTALERAWGELQAGESLARGVRLAPLRDERKAYPAARGADVVRFITETHRAYLNRLRDHARSHAPPGVGIAVIPFSYDTQYRPSTAWTYTLSAGDVQSFGMYFWNYDSVLSSPPGMYVMDSTTVAGKPTVIYETNRGRPSPYRAEYPFMVAAFGAWQDWDAIFFHYWGGPRAPAADEQYLLAALNNGNPDHYWTMVHHAQDPVMSAALAVAGKAFRSGAIAPAPAPATYKLGAKGIFGYRYHHGVNQRQMAFTQGSRLEMDPTAEYGLQVPAGATDDAPTGPVAAGDEILWDWPNGRLIVDTPTAKFLVGRTANHTFRDGITISGFDHPWAAIGLVSDDGKPLADGSERALLSAVSNAQNTGFVIDLKADLSGPQNQIKARRANGRAPVQVDRVGFTLGFPSAIDGQLVVHDFARRERSRHAFGTDGAVRLQEEELFIGVVEIAARGALRSAAVDPVRWRTAAKRKNVESGAPSPGGAWFPLEGLSWDTGARDAVAVLGRVGTPARLQGEHVVVDRGYLLLDAPSQITLRYEQSRIVRVEATVIEPPTWEEVETALRSEFGSPNHRKLGAQFENSVVRWRTERPGGRYSVELTETQGVMYLSVVPIVADASSR